RRDSRNRSEGRSDRADVGGTGGGKSSMTSLIPRACRSFVFACLMCSLVAADLAGQDEPLVRLAQRPPTPTAAWDPAAVLIEQSVAGTPAGAAELLRRLATE